MERNCFVNYCTCVYLLIVKMLYISKTFFISPFRPLVCTPSSVSQISRIQTHYSNLWVTCAYPSS